MPELSMWTPISGGGKELLPELRFFETALSFGGKSYRIIDVQDDKILVKKCCATFSFSTLLTTLLKVVAVCTVIFPILALVGKMYYRKINKFVLVPNTASLHALGRKPGQGGADPLPPLFTPEELAEKKTSILRRAGILKEELQQIHSILQDITNIDDLVSTNLLLDSWLKDIQSKKISIDREFCRTIRENLHGPEKREAIALLDGNTHLYDEATSRLKESILTSREQIAQRFEAYETGCKTTPKGSAIKIQAEKEQFNEFLLEKIDELSRSFFYSKFIPPHHPQDAISTHLGINNLGNSCWLNSCMQSLLCSQAFTDQLNCLHSEKFPKFLLEEKRLLLHYIKQLKDILGRNSANAKEVENTMRHLRDGVFTAHIGEYPLYRIHDQFDPGSLYEALMKFMGFGFILQTTAVAVFDDKMGHSYPPQSTTHPDFMLRLETSGLSIQQALERRLSQFEPAPGGWRPGGLVPLQKHTKECILGPSPKMLIIQSKQNLASEWSAEGQYVIKAQDAIVNLRPLMHDVKPTEPAVYKLVGIARKMGDNPRAGHWVSYGVRQGRPYFFNDSCVTEEESLVGKKADYLVYELM